MGAVRAARHQRVKPIPLGQRLGLRRSAKADPEDPSITPRRTPRRIGHRHLIRAVERAKPEMHDPDPVMRGRMARRRHVRRRAVQIMQPHARTKGCSSAVITQRISASPRSRPMAG
jgi:hypothetical protein